MNVDCGVYRDGRRLPRAGGDRKGHRRAGEAPDLDAALAAVRGAGGRGERGEHGDFLWLHLVEPDAGQLEPVAARLGLHPLAVEDAVSAHQRPKLELYGDVVFAVVKTLRPASASASGRVAVTGELALFAGPDFVVTVRHGPDDPVRAIRERLPETPRELGHGPSAVLHLALDTAVGDYTSIVTELAADLSELETEAFAPVPDPRLSARIYQGKRQVVALRRATAPLEQPLNRLAGGGVPHVRDVQRAFFRGTADDLARAQEQIEAMDRLLTDMLEAGLTRVALRQGDDMRKISAWAALAAVPTLIAGVYGMNFDHMPELSWRWGYPGAIALMVGACWVLHRVFKRSGWL